MFLESKRKNGASIQRQNSQNLLDDIRALNTLNEKFTKIATNADSWFVEYMAEKLLQFIKKEE